jgi:hypothetical protein
MIATIIVAAEPFGGRIGHSELPHTLFLNKSGAAVIFVLTVILALLLSQLENI